MKQNRFLLIVLALGLSGSALSAQTADDQPPQGRPGEGQPPPPRNRRGPERQRPPQPPIISALDLNHDGVIDADEISKASDSLKKLDKNGDGNLTPDELRPEGAFGQGGPGFRGPAGYPGDSGQPGQPRRRDSQAGQPFDPQAPRPGPGDGGPQEGPDKNAPRPPLPPMFAALDLNHDGVIDADEIAKAPESLKALDKNGDGKLTPDEIRPRFGGRRSGEEFWDGDRRPGVPGDGGSDQQAPRARPRPAGE